MVISCKPSEYRVNDRIYNFLSIFFLNSPIAIFIFFFLNTYIKQSLCQKKKSVLKFKHFAKYPRFAFGYLFFLSCRLQNARNAVSDNQIPPPSPPQRDLRLRPRLVRLLVEWHLPVKKNLATGLETAKVRYIQSSCFARETLCCFLMQLEEKVIKGRRPRWMTKAPRGK